MEVPQIQYVEKVVDRGVAAMAWGTPGTLLLFSAGFDHIPVRALAALSVPVANNGL